MVDHSAERYPVSDHQTHHAMDFHDNFPDYPSFSKFLVQAGVTMLQVI
jgi:hypothetical protein